MPFMTLEPDDFTRKVEELINSNDHRWAIHYDVAHDQITIVELGDSDEDEGWMIYHSPKLSKMSEAVYRPFRTKLEELMPEARPDRKDKIVVEPDLYAKCEPYENDQGWWHIPGCEHIDWSQDEPHLIQKKKT
jgi:hypothetical protein